MSNPFEQLGIAPDILKAIEEVGFEEPTEVQRQAIPSVLQDKDLIVRSKTGSGKTAAFGLPILQRIDSSSGHVEALILTPTRELAVQVDSDLKRFSKFHPAKTAAVYGQHSINIEIQELKKGVSIITGTPGRVFDHIRSNHFSTKHIRYLVLDEADRMLDMGFIDQVVRIIKSLPKERVTLLFSATMPDEIQKICRSYMKEAEVIEIESDTKTVDTIRQSYHRVEHNEKRTQLARILTIEQPDSCMIFCNTRMTVNRVQEFLMKKGYTCQSLHGDIAQSKRLKTINQFKEGKFHLLIATDVAARGIHIDDMDLVINYDVPVEKDSYVHRIGRTGRAGNGGRAITLVTSDDIMSLYEIEEHIGAMIPEEDLPTDEAVETSLESALLWSKSKTNAKDGQRMNEDEKTTAPSNGEGRKPRVNVPRPKVEKRPADHLDDILNQLASTGSTYSFDGEVLEDDEEQDEKTVDAEAVKKKRRRRKKKPAAQQTDAEGNVIEAQDSAPQQKPQQKPQPKPQQKPQPKPQQQNLQAGSDADEGIDDADGEVKKKRRRRRPRRKKPAGEQGVEMQGQTPHQAAGSRPERTDERSHHGQHGQHGQRSHQAQRSQHTQRQHEPRAQHSQHTQHSQNAHEQKGEKPSLFKSLWNKIFKG